MASSSSSSPAASAASSSSEPPRKSLAVRIFVFIVLLLQFLVLRTLHLWEAATRITRAMTSEGTEVFWSNVGFLFRYLALVPTVWLTVLTIQADQDDDEDRFRELILWGLIPSAVRVFTSMWTSTIDRSMAKELELSTSRFAKIINTQRMAMGIPLDKVRRRLPSCFLVWKQVPGGDHAHSTLSDRVDTRRKRFRRYHLMATYFERPLSFVVQKVATVVLLVIFFFPDLDDEGEIGTAFRWARIFTTVLLAPMNHYLGRLRVQAFHEIEREYIQVMLGLVRDAVADIRAGKDGAVAAGQALVNKPDEARAAARARLDELHARSNSIVSKNRDSRKSDKLVADLFEAHREERSAIHAADELEEAFASCDDYAQLVALLSASESGSSGSESGSESESGSGSGSESGSETESGSGSEASSE